MKLILLFILIPFILLAQPTTFSKAKKELRKQFPSGKTFYCGCDYKFIGKKSVIDWESCGYKPRKNAKRASRIEWEHIVPAYNFGRQFKCWREGHEDCITKKGKEYKGRRCCKKVNPTFKAMEADMNNLVPAIGEVNGDRSNFRFSMIAGEKRQYGQCNFEIDFKNRVAEPRPEVRKKIAETYFYMEKKYGMKISKKDRKTLEGLVEKLKVLNFISLRR